MELTPEVAPVAAETTAAAEVAILAAVAHHVALATEKGTEEHLRSVYAQADERAAGKAAAKLGKAMDMSEEHHSLRIARLWACAVEGAALSELRKAAGAARSGLEHVAVPTRYAHLSRGKCWGRHADGGWAPKEGTKVHLDRPGKWVVGSDDGFARKDKTSWTVLRVGPYLFGW